MWRTWGWKLRGWARISAVVLAAGTLAYLTVWSLLNAFGQHDVVNTAALFSVAAAAIAGGVSLATVLRARGVLTSSELADVADQLARRVMDAEEKELRRLLGEDITRIDIGFEFHPISNRNATGASPFGHLDEIRQYYQRLSPQRLAIIGKPGSGKTVLALELIVKLLEDRQRRGAERTVPVRFSLSRWDNTRTLESWLADELTGVYQLAPPVAIGLLEAKLVVPVLDGLDEMDPEGVPPERAATLIAKLNAWVRGARAAPLIVTCREEQYSLLSQYPQLAGPAGTKLIDTATVIITSVTVTQAVRYITERVRDPGRWEPVIERLADGDGALAAALNTPWRLTLAITVYGGFLRVPLRQARPPEELAEHTENMDEHLLRDYVRAATAAHPLPGRRVRQHEEVEPWLRELAVYLDGNARASRVIGGRVLSGTDIVLHLLWPLAGDRRPRRADTALAAVMSVPGFVWFGIFAFSHGFWKILFFLVLAVYSAALWRASSAYWIAPKPFDYRQLLTWRGLAQLAVACGIGIITAFVSTPWIGAAVGFGAWVAGGVSITPMQGLVTTVIPVSSPRNPLRHDLRLSLVSALSAVPALGLAFTEYLGAAVGLASGIVYAVLVGLTVASAPWRRYLALLLCTRGRLPWRLGWFLDWACEAGLLRVSGIAYQFRHRELQDWLASNTRT